MKTAKNNVHPSLLLQTLTTRLQNLCFFSSLIVYSSLLPFLPSNQPDFDHYAPNFYRLCNRTPWHRDQNPTLHTLNQRHRLMHGISPPLDTPALLPPHLPLLQICKLPQMMHRIQFSNLHKPGSYSFHDFSSCAETAAPMGLPFEKITGVEGVGAQFEDATEGSGRGGGPEGEFLH
jgi:hypothetical protein